MEVEANGKTFTFPEGTTNDQIGEAVDSYFSQQSQPAQQPAAPKQNPSQVFDRIKKEKQDSGFFGAKYIEPALNMASSVVAEPLAILAGAADSINPFSDFKDSSEAANSVRDMLTYDPSTEDGKAGMQAIGDAMNKDLVGETSIADVVVPAFDALGDSAANTFDFFGANPDYGRQFGKALPDLFGVGMAAKPVLNALKGVPSVAKTAGKAVAQTAPAKVLGNELSLAGSALADSRIIKPIIEQSGKKQKMALDILSKSTDNNLAKFKVSKSGKLVDDKLATKAINSGLNDGMAQALKSGSKTDRLKAAEMTRIRKMGKENSKFELNNRPSDVAGKTFMDRYNFIAGKNKVAGRKLDNVANSLKGEKANFSGAMQNFNTNLSNLGIRMDDAGKLDFRGSVIEGLQPQQAVKKMVQRLQRAGRGGSIDAFDAHQMKKYIDEVVSGYGKNAEGLKGKTELVFKRLRADIDGALDTKYPRYDKVNTQYADTRQAMDAFADISGKKMDMKGKRVNGAVGQLLRRLTSNAVSRTPLDDAVDLISDTAKKYGGNFDGDIKMQAAYANHLDEIFGPSADTSLLGDLVKSGKRAAVESGTGRAPIGAAADTAAAVTSKIMNKSDDKAFKAIMRMLNDSK